MTREQHLAAIHATCVRLLEIAKRRTAGKWTHYCSRVCSEDEYHDADRVDNVDVCHNIDWRQGEPKQKTTENLEFIAACAGNAERGWETTIVAIDAIEKAKRSFSKISRLPEGWEGNAGANSEAEDGFDDLSVAQDAIIAQWPEESLIIKDNEPCEGRR